MRYIILIISLEWGMLTLELSSYLLEIPDNGFMFSAQSQILLADWLM